MKRHVCRDWMKHQNVESTQRTLNPNFCMMTDDEASLRFNDNPTQSATDLTQTSNSVEISFPAILLTLLSPQLLAVFPDPDFK